jgi:tetratricopeptide (TPR) repeat protein
MSNGTTNYPWWRNDASVFAALLAFAAIAFTSTYFITKAYGRRQDSLARHWLQQGSRNLVKGQAKLAVADFRTALRYSHDNPAYRLRLAQALAADGETSQAIAYFLNLLEEQPGNGLYNLELARLYSQQGNNRKAAQYYNAAIYGAWDTDPATARRNARTEYIHFLLTHNAPTQAQAEAIILASAVSPNDIPARLQSARVLLDTGEYNRALEEYSALMKNDPVAAALGAGQAAFQSGRFQSAAKFLSIAIARGATDPSAPTLLQRAKSVLDVDPNRRRIGSSDRAKRVMDAYDTAGDRLQACSVIKNQPLTTVPPATDLQKLYDEWKAANENVGLKNLRQDPDLRDSVMDLVGRIEEKTSQLCGTPTGDDWALLMLSRYGEGVEH